MNLHHHPTFSAYLAQWQQHPQQFDLHELSDSVAKVWLSSPFVAEICLHNPLLLKDLLESGDLFQAYASYYPHHLSALNEDDETVFMAELRHLRRREMLRIAWRDLAGWSDLDETLTDLSALADACIERAHAFSHARLAARFGEPVLANGHRQQMIILGMGKLGAGELNFSSDIDLIFAYAEDGVLPDKKQTTYSEFFNKVARLLIKLLDAPTQDGFVFRVDARLRPFGDSGPLVMSFDGLEHYYLTQAREWERYAMIKARQIGGNHDHGAPLQTMLQAFVYRRYLDYGALEEIRGLKQKIAQELARKDRLDNIKLGVGGIREIEFIAQAFQLIRGGQEPALRCRELQQALHILGALEVLKPEETQELIQHYRFLRRLENRLQAYQDRQTHDLPDTEDAQAALALAMDYQHWPELAATIEQTRNRVHHLFCDIFRVDTPDEEQSPEYALWHNCDSEQARKLGFKNPEAVVALLQTFKHSSKIQRLTQKGQATLERLLPDMLTTISQQPEPDMLLPRLLHLFETVAGRTIYLTLLAENPKALAHVVRLSG
ncbi:MAG: bifunctional [glutamate--ammonia ligase]-adenylyl-L-tyrosine phosphorylase/[glutamate--ammonia-ligase] adenylyltransferase, partial [Methylococcales bacterium]|nr:bifunctional [glutamate--ammonia ligase]-adenylyl-L-tyrosine phosphorylase/[glutamate--ammonia-ligase] adenylyltransferase [Methylococcales bacterium]